MTRGRRQRFPTWWQGLIILVSGVVIGFSSCAAFLDGANFGGGGNSQQGMQGFFVFGFFAGLALALAGFILFIIGVARVIVNALRAPEPLPMFTPVSAAGETPGEPGPPTADSPLAREETPEQRLLRRFQIALVVFMLMPAASIATSVLVVMGRTARMYMWQNLTMIVVSYVLSQAPYGFALARTRRGPDRLGIAIAFAASCALAVEGLLPFVRATTAFSTRVGFFGWPALFLIGHVVVAVYAWRAGKLAPADSGDTALIAGSFAGVVAYLFAIRFVEASLLQLYMNAMRYH